MIDRIVDHGWAGAIHQAWCDNPIDVPNNNSMP
jgi:hypothetical protein